MTQELIIYEQPVNELIRVCLRLEHLFTQLDLHMKQKVDIHTRDTMSLLIEIINVLDRPDLKSKFTQEFHRLIAVFSRLQNAPDIRKEKLDETLKDLQELSNYLINTRGKIAQSLRDNEFISTIRVHILTPGGDCCFETPSYHYWLQQPSSTHLVALENWLTELKHIRAAMALLLSIARQSAEPQDIIAEKGFYHGILNSQTPCQLVRIILPKKIELYPEASVGKHRMNIRFHIPTIVDRPRQTDQDVSFQLVVCNI